MRPTLFVGGVLGVLCCFWAAQAQVSVPEPGKTPSAAPHSTGKYPAWMTVTVPAVNVHSGGSEKFLATGSLRQGDRVVVLAESAKFKGWLEIVPPNGSYSWIKAKYLKRTDIYTAFVEAAEGEEVPIRPGKVSDSQVPDQNHKYLKRGQLVSLLNDIPVTHNGEQWLPITPVPGEVRYIPAAAVAGSSTEMVPQLAQQTGSGQSVAAGLTAAQQQPGHPAPLQVQFANRRTVHYSAPPAATAATQATALAGQWSKWGRLRRTGYVYQGEPLYALEDHGRLITYAVTGKDLTLEPYVNRLICLYGTVTANSPGYTSSNYMFVSHVAVP